MLVREGLKKIPPDFRAALILMDLLDFDYRQAAEILEISFGNAKSRLARARVQICEELLSQTIGASEGNHRPRNRT